MTQLKPKTKLAPTIHVARNVACAQKALNHLMSKVKGTKGVIHGGRYSSRNPTI